MYFAFDDYNLRTSQPTWQFGCSGTPQSTQPSGICAATKTVRKRRRRIRLILEKKNASQTFHWTLDSTLEVSVCDSGSFPAPITKWQYKWKYHEKGKQNKHWKNVPRTCQCLMDSIFMRQSISLLACKWKHGWKYHEKDKQRKKDLTSAIIVAHHPLLVHHNLPWVQLQLHLGRERHGTIRKLSCIHPTKNIFIHPLKIFLFTP